MRRIAEQSHPAFPVTIYYAFKQSEHKGEVGMASTGWETFLDAVISAGFSVSGTWPVRTERQNRKRNQGSNALASSIVLVCLPRAADAPAATRREFLDALRSELPEALRKMQLGNISPGGPGTGRHRTGDGHLHPLRPGPGRQRRGGVRPGGPRPHQRDLGRGSGRTGRGLRCRHPLGVGLVRPVGFQRGCVRRGRNPLHGQEHQCRRDGGGGHSDVGRGQGAPARSC